MILHKARLSTKQQNESSHQTHRSIFGGWILHLKGKAELGVLPGDCGGVQLGKHPGGGRDGFAAVLVLL